MKSAAPFVAIVCGVFVALVVGIAAFGDRIGLGHLSDGINDKLSMVTSLISPQPEKAPEAAAKPESVAAAKKEADGATQKEPAQAEKASDFEPTFDIVRVEPDGSTLVAGRAQPGWIVELKNGSAILSKAVANSSGEWVMVLNDPLGVGVSDLSLSAQAEEGGEVVVSQSSVTVSRSGEKDGELLVVETEPGKASKVLASIAKPEETEASPAAAQSAAPASSENSPAVNEVPVASEAANAEGSESPAPSASAQTDGPISADKPSVEQPAGTMVVASKTNDVGAAAGSEDVSTPSAVAGAGKVETAATGQTISIEAVEIEGDMLFVAGAAEPSGSMLRLYVDNGEIANGRSGETGRFLFDNRLALDAGSHVVRVDLLDGASGAVLTRAEVTFSKQPGVLSTVSAQGSLGDKYQRGVSASGESGSVETKKVIIRRGDNLWTIARRVYGAGIRYSTIYDTNNDQIRDPHWIYPGQVFELPKGEDGWDSNYDSVENPELNAMPAPEGSAVSG